MGRRHMDHFGLGPKNEMRNSKLNIESEKDWFFQDWLSEKTYRDDLREILVQIHGLPKTFLGIKKDLDELD